MVIYDRLIGNGDGYAELPISMKAGWTYSWNVQYFEDRTNVQTTGMFASGGGASIYHSSYREMRIWLDGATSAIWSGFAGLEQLKFAPDGVYRNGVQISTFAITADPTTTITLYKNVWGEIAMGDFVQLRSLEVLNAEGVLVHRFRPCKIGNAVGLFDEIGKLYAINVYTTNPLTVENDVE